MCRWLLSPHPPIQAPVLNGLSEMIGSDAVSGRQVGNRARDLEELRVGARGEFEFLHGLRSSAIASALSWQGPVRSFAESRAFG